MTNKLGVYWSVMHRRPQDYDYFEDLQPSVLKIMDGGPNDYAHAREAVPDTLLIARDWALSEQQSDMLRDPVGTGTRHAREWSDHQVRLGFDRAKTLVLGINEPHVWEPGVSEALRLYTISLCNEATHLGLRVGAMQLSVGWPNNTGPDTPPDWSPWHGVEEAILHNNGALVCHEYFADQGPSENWGWWCGRTLKCPWQVPIVIGECGVDMFVKDTSVGQQRRGWLGHMPPERYAQELAEYTSRMSADPRFVGCCVFASDFAAHEWYSFDVEPAYKAILALPAPTDTHTVYIPAAGSGTTMYVQAKDGANIRAVPTLDGTRLGGVPLGDAVTVLSDLSSQWVRVQYQGIDGYIYRSLLGKDKPQPAPDDGPQPTPQGDNFRRVIEWVLRWEGGFQNNPADHGNYRPDGTLVGTNFGISARSYPTLDIPNITRQQAIDIYRRDYWTPSGASTLAWPLCLLVMDTAVLHGVGAATQWLKEVGPNPFAFAAKRLRVYTHSDNWQAFAAGWINRAAELLEEMGR